MEEKQSEAAALPWPNTDSPASSRRRGGAQKRKANVLNSSNSSSTPSKRITREKASPAHPPMHNGPLTRARQIPNNLASAASASAVCDSSSDFAVDPVKQREHSARTEALGADLVAVVKEFNKGSEWEALEATIEAEFEAIRSLGTNVHVVPSHCGWFSWTDIHPIEKHTLPSFFNGKTENRTPNIYLEIRNWVIEKFHENPHVQIELKDLSELNVGDLDTRQEVMEFLDHWGLINFQPFPSMDSAVAIANNGGDVEKISLIENFYQLETLQLCTPIVPKKSIKTPAMPSGLYPESTFAEELLKEEEPAVEYHCNSCSADCSRKRYHCQKKADFDLCTSCFSNRKFGSGMHTSDFILMEPAEVPGLSGGKWTDQETLLLLEALELYKENWNEIAEHVATKTKAQCILHFVQMPIEDTFFNCTDGIDASCKETADPTATDTDSSVLKDASEMNDSKTTVGTEGQVLNPCNETSRAEDADKVEVNEETLKPENACQEKTSEETSVSGDAAEVKSSQEAGDDYALKALKEAFEAVGYSPGPEGPYSFAEVGNPALAMAVFLAHLVGSDVAVASAHSSLKSISGNSPSIELAGRHCFHLEGPLDEKKEPISAKRDFRNVRDQDGKNEKQDNSMLDGKDLSNDLNHKKIENSASEDSRHMISINERASEKVFASKDQEMAKNGEVGLNNSNLELPSHQARTTVQESDGLTSKAEIPPSSEKSKEGNLVKDPCFVEELKDGHVVSNSLPAEKNELQQSITFNPKGEHPQPSETPKEAEMVSDSIPSDKGKSQKPPTTSLVAESLKTEDSVIDINIVSNPLLEKSDSQPFVASNSSQHTGTEKGIDMISSCVPFNKNESSHPVTASSGAENEASAGEDHTENGLKEDSDGTKTKHGNKFENVKRAAVSTLTAAAVKAKLLANQEEKQIRKLATLLIEKQLHKLETKLAFFNEMESVVMRLREHLDRSRQKLYHERALIIASRFGLPASSSRGVTSPNNRIPVNCSHSVSRPPISMYPQRPPISRSMGSVFNTLSNPLTSTTMAGNSAHPSSLGNLSSVGTK